MPEKEITIGGRGYRVAFDDGQEAALDTAAGYLDGQARTLLAAVGQIPESRMLLMSGLMLADQMLEHAKEMKALEEKIRATELRAERAEAEAAKITPAAAAPSEPEPQSALFDEEGERSARELLEQMVLELEALADDLEAVD
ncbi:cell division protein ZapA [Rubricella aquisinus]|uniref:Cell division protein ZapA n=1 Tax=Rubricella aquisinus TaxID=2028108 RepID=A0A840WNC6_9RHOB|nr:cell division protein ZapA [Rubricella aquisinus]MBB5516559.1 cell division protein ZapA [Rubricella aquisinus]